MIIFKPLLTTFETSNVLRQLGQLHKLFQAKNQATISKFNQDKFVQICKISFIKSFLEWNFENPRNISIFL